MTRAAAILLSVGAVIVAPAQAQQYVVSTYAGVAQQPNASSGYFGLGVAADAAGNVYFSSDEPPYCYCVFKLDQNGVVSRIAGNYYQAGFSGDGGPAASALLNRPNGLAVDGLSNLFIADSANNRIRKIFPDGTITTVAGTGQPGQAQDGELATSASLFPSAVAADRAGNLFISDLGIVEPGGSLHPRVLKVSPDGIITTVAGNGTCCFSGDGGPATDAQLVNPTGVALDDAGNLFIADGNVVRKVSTEGIITTVAGPGPPNPNPSQLNPNSDCVAGVSGDGGPATQAPLCYANSVTVDPAGNLFIVELMGVDLGVSYSVAVRKVSPDGIITTVDGVGPYLYWGGQAAFDAGGNLLIADGDSVRRVSPKGIVSTVAGTGACCDSGDGGPATSAQLDLPRGLGVDGAGNLFIADQGNHRIRRVSPDGIITTVAGSLLTTRCLKLSGESGPASRAQLCNPFNIAVDAAGNVFLADGPRVRKVSPDGRINSVAGNGTSGYSGDGGLATEAQLSYAGAVGVDAAGNLYFQDLFRIREVSASGIITTVACTGYYGQSGDGGLPSARRSRLGIRAWQ